MALHGDLRSFALPDVLRLLAGTAKSGRLAVDAPATSGEVWMRDGGIAGGAIGAAPHATTASDVVFELLRLDGGSFVFEEDEDLAESMDAELTSVEDALTDAEALVAEWTEVEAVVPSMAAWVTFAPEIDGDEVTVSAAQWRMLAAIGNGGTVADLADALELTDLAASRGVKELVEAAIAEVRTDHVFAEEPTIEIPVELDTQAREEEPFDPDALHREMQEDLELLRADERPVVMEDAEDALLPEPLPGAGVSYAADTIATGHVDGRMDAIDHPAPFDAEAPVAEAPATDDAPAGEGWAFAQPLEETEPATDQGEADPIHAAAAEAYEVFEAIENAPETGEVTYHEGLPRHDFHAKGGYRGLPSLEEELAADEPRDDEDDASARMEPSPVEQEDKAAEDDRGSLLKFLSTVQP